MTARIIVTGSRTWTDTAEITAHLEWAARRHPGAVLVHGDAHGADRIAARLWQSWGLPVEPHPVTREDWQRHGRRAGYLRNAHMVQVGAVLCLAFIRDHSAGASMCADLAERAGIPTVRIRPEEQR